MILVSGALVVTIIALEIALRIGGALFLFLQERRNMTSLRRYGEYRIMCLGESTTALGGRDSYPSQLEEILNQRGKSTRFSVINNGIPGSGTKDLMLQLQDNIKKYRPHMVITMMGINDGFAKHMPGQPVSNSLLSYSRAYKLLQYIYLHLTRRVLPAKTDPIASINPPQPPPQQRYPERSANVSQGFEYKERGEFSRARDSFTRAIELNPLDEEAYVGLGYANLELRDFPAMEGSFRKVLEIDPKNYEVTVVFGQLLGALGQPAEAESLLKKAVEIDPFNESAYFELGCLYQKQKDFTLAEENFIKSIKINPENSKAYGALAVVYQGSGKKELAEEYSRKIKKVCSDYYNPVTTSNYRELKKILDQNRIKLVCVQYPMRSVEPLKRIFLGEAGVIFVDNETIFKNKVNEDGYMEYFTDMFGGDFGHCTRKGNRLLATNIANEILKTFQ